MKTKPAEVIDRCLAPDAPNNHSETDGAALCGLQRLVDCGDLPDELRDDVRRLLSAGFTLRRNLPTIDSYLISQWLGGRWWLIHQAQLAHLQDWSAIVGSRLSGTDPEFCGWPAWIERAVQSLARDERTLLLVEGTTTTSLVQPLARRANLKCLNIHLPPDSPTRKQTVGRWLLERLAQFGSTCVQPTSLWLSSPVTPASDLFAHLPLRDRVVVALAHRLVVLSIRPRGNMAELVSMRLKDTRFPMGTVSIRLPGLPSMSDREWLDQQAVGWYLPRREEAVKSFSLVRGFDTNCPKQDCIEPATGLAVAQWTAHASLWRATSEYLLHCVRGDHAQAFREGHAEAVLDAVAQGSLPSLTPFESLLRILASRRLRASGKLLRTGTTAVSFTAVPLVELMRRRRYQAHLGRWDWEPYGLMVRRDILEQLGARPVIYGDEDVFDHLDGSDRHFFQPARRRSARRDQEHWQAEEEWRLLDDVRLGELPAHSLLLFVETIAQAQALAAHGPWPVIYLQAVQTPRSPGVAKHRRRSSARTNRN